MEIIGGEFRLRPLRKGDMANKVRWYNDPEVNRTLLLDEHLDLKKTLEWFDKRKGDKSRREFAVESKDGRPIGITGLIHIDPVHKTAECFCVIGEKDWWGRGIGTEVHRLLVDWGYKKLGLDKVWADIRAENTAIIKVIGKLGFKVEGTLRQERLIAGRRIDVVRIGLLKEEFYTVHPELGRATIVENRYGGRKND